VEAAAGSRQAAGAPVRTLDELELEYQRRDHVSLPVDLDLLAVVGQRGQRVDAQRLLGRHHDLDLGGTTWQAVKLCVFGGAAAGGAGRRSLPACGVGGPTSARHLSRRAAAHLEHARLPGFAGELLRPPVSSLAPAAAAAAAPAAAPPLVALRPALRRPASASRWARQRRWAAASCSSCARAIVRGSMVHDPGPWLQPGPTGAPAAAGLPPHLYPRPQVGDVCCM
jgi:hypothetical protein